MKIRKSTEQDFTRIMEIYAFAREYMKTHGNPNQWGPTNWPPETLIHDDIEKGNSYVCLNDSEKVIGVFYFIHGDNIVMQNLLKKLGFNPCGTIYVEEDDFPRLAFEKF